jgi:N-acetylglucosaminyl-diphospho-decaprenol L-rhamnosyltransferase
MTVTVIIVNYQTSDLVVDCLLSLKDERSRVDDFSVVVVDNASPDRSVEVLTQLVESEKWGDWVKLVSLDLNGGFAYGNNKAIKSIDLSLTKYVVLLNPDTVVRSGAIEALVSFMDENPSAGIAGSRLEHVDGEPQVSAFRFHSPWSEFEASARVGILSRLLARRRVAMDVEDRPHKADWVAGACMIIRTNVIREIGLMDEKYFMYFEEVDYCRRVKRAGWSIWYVPESRVIHLVGKSSGIGDTTLGRRRLPRYWFESRQWYFRKNHGWFGILMANCGRLVGHGIWSIYRRLRGHPECDPPYFIRDLISQAWANSIHRSGK